MPPLATLLVVALIACYHKIGETARPALTLRDHMIERGGPVVLLLLVWLWQYGDPATVVASGVLMVV